MKKFILLYILFNISFFKIKSQNTNQILISDNYKVKESFSSDLFGTSSFHIITTQNKTTKDFDLLIYKYDNHKITKLSTITTYRLPTILSFHKSKNTLTLLVSHNFKSEDFFTVYDIDLITGDYKNSKSYSNSFSTALYREKDKTILLNGEFNYLKATIIKKHNDIKTIELGEEVFTKDILKNYFRRNGRIVVINQNEFVQNGSITATQSYFKEDKLLITNNFIAIDNVKRSFVTNILEFDLNKAKLNERSIKGKTFKRVLSANSYILDNLIVQFCTSYNKGNLRVYNYDKSELLSEYNLEDLNSVISKGKDFTSISNFIRKSNNDIFMPTVTLNKTIDDNYLVTVSYVKKDYVYYNNWWWYKGFIRGYLRYNTPHNNHIRFGSNKMSNLELTKKKKERFFTLVINSEGKIVEKNENTVFKNIDKRFLIDELEDDKKLKFTSGCLINNQIFRYIYYNKKNKTFSIKNEKKYD